MNVLHLHPGPDTGGKSMAAKAALEAMGDSVRVFVKAPHPFNYPQAEMWDDAAVNEAVEWADIVVAHNEPSLAVGRNKPLMIHHHGSRLRKAGLSLWEQGDRLGAVQVVSTHDLLEGLPPSVGWLPQIVDVDAIAAIREREYRPHSAVVVSHAPTSRVIKGTRLVLRASRTRGATWTLDLISRKPWAECLARKARSDVYFDQLQLGFGANAIECWAMGLPVIAGASPRTLARMRTDFELPFYRSTPDSLSDDLRTFAADAGLRREWGERGLIHARRYHDNAPFVEAFRRYARMAIDASLHSAA